MGITVLNIIILQGKFSDFWLPIVFYGSADALPQNEISDHKTDDLPTQWQFWGQLSHYSKVVPSIVVYINFLKG